MSLTGSITDWQYLALISSYLGGIIFITLKYHKDLSNLVYGLIFALFSTILYIGASEFCFEKLSGYCPELTDNFPSIHYSLGMVMILMILLFARPVLRLSRRFVHLITSGVLLMLIASSTGAIIGFSKMNPLDGSLFASASSMMENGPGIQDNKFFLLYHGLLILAYISLFSFKNMFRHPASPALSIILAYLASIFTVLFYVEAGEVIFLSERIMWMNTLQWGLLLVLILLFLKVISLEGLPLIIEVKYKPKLRSDYLLFIFYLALTAITLKISPIFTVLDEYLFLSVFAATTFFMIIYYYSKIKAPQLKFSVVSILLIMGFIFVQTRMERSGNQFEYNKDIPLEENLWPVSSRPNSNEPIEIDDQNAMKGIQTTRSDEPSELIYPIEISSHSFSFIDKYSLVHLY
jgi:hypothetical protein